MATYLLLWNPKRYNWNDLAIMSKKVKEGIPSIIRWSCGNSRHIKSGDRIFMKRDGRGRSAVSRRLRRLWEDPRGIFASGRVITGSFEDEHWDKAAALGITMYVEVELDTLLDPESDDILPRELLKSDKRFSAMHWDSQRSGIQIPDEIATELEKVWADFTTTSRDTPSPEEVADTTGVYEGALRKISVNVYERSRKARRMCIKHYGEHCYVCGFDFFAKYGEIGKGFIHIHHLTPLSEVGEEYKVDPVKDLRPICPNCHAIIHRRQPAYSIEEVRAFLRKTE
ncbi:HNH endonuclease [Candidatus Acetothermia bacterium]|jgi:5-methylcytosine-specific restriction protein A|nr:HNH endonuclease [Candidatus Acetothermia bacterium]MCI2437269.1 HNH endonuclease [Candidatus Acetothermia bacterium]